MGTHSPDPRRRSQRERTRTTRSARRDRRPRPRHPRDRRLARRSMEPAHHTTGRSTRHASDSTASQQPSKPNASNQTAANAAVQLFEQANDDSDELLLQYDLVDPEPGTEQANASSSRRHADHRARLRPCPRRRRHTPTHRRRDRTRRPSSQPANTPSMPTSSRPRSGPIERCRRSGGGTSSAKPARRSESTATASSISRHSRRANRSEFASGVATDLTRIEAALRRVRNEATPDAACELARALEDVNGRPFDSQARLRMGSRQRSRVLRRSPPYRRSPRAGCAASRPRRCRRSAPRDRDRPARFPRQRDPLPRPHPRPRPGRATREPSRTRCETFSRHSRRRTRTRICNPKRSPSTNESPDALRRRRLPARAAVDVLREPRDEADPSSSIARGVRRRVSRGAKPLQHKGL